MKLYKPSLRFRKSWEAALKEFNAEHARGFWNVPEKPTSIHEYIRRVRDHQKGRNLPEYWVPATTYWLIDKGKFVGHCNIRHKLTPKLRTIGGHIGYFIRPGERRKGYGTKILELALKKARHLGLKKVMVTCNDDNIGSQKIIEKNGGKLKDKVQTEEGLVRHYWVEIRELLLL